MEIKEDDISEIITDPLQIFYTSFKSPATAETQTRALKKILCEFLGPILKGDPEAARQFRERQHKAHPILSQVRYSKADFEARARELVTRCKEDPKWGEAMIIKLMHKLEERTKLEKTNPEYLTKGAVRNYYFPLQRLLESGNVELPWKRIRRSVPKQTGHGRRAWELPEIQKMLQTANIEEKPLILIAASSGIREGGMWFRWEHIFTVYDYNGQYVWEPFDVTDEVKRNGRIVCGLLHVYADSQDDDDYFGLITPECLDAISEYKIYWKKTWGTEPLPNDIFFRKHGPVTRKLKESGIRQRMEIIQERCGLRQKLLPNVRRHEVQPFTGFRKFFDKATKKAASKNSLFGKLILNEKMMGHDGMIRLNRNYFREVISELIDEYIPAIPNLTISEDAQAKLETPQQHITDSEIRQKLDDMLLDKLDTDIDLRLQRIENEELRKRLQNPDR